MEQLEALEQLLHPVGQAAHLPRLFLKYPDLHVLHFPVNVSQEEHPESHGLMHFPDDSVYPDSHEEQLEEEEQVAQPVGHS